MSGDDSQLPQGWIKTTLSEVVFESKMKIEPNAFGNLPYIGLEHIASGSNCILSIGKATDVNSTKSRFKSGDILYGRLRPYLNKVCWPDFDGICSTDILVFPSSLHLDNGYLLYFLSQQSTVEYATQNSNGINLPRISASTLGKIDFPLPPLAEQRRIVAKLKGLRKRSRVAREELAATEPLLEQFRQAVLATAFRGDLTAEWRKAHPDVEPANELLQRIRVERRREWEEAELAKYKVKGRKPPKNWQRKYKEPEPVDVSELSKLPKSWRWVRVDEISTKITDGVHKKPNYVESGVPFLTVKNLTANSEISFEDTKFITELDHHKFIKRTNPEKGDILVTKDGTLGVTRIVETKQAFSIFVSLALIKPVFREISPFLVGVLQAPQGQSGMKATGTGLQHIHLVDLRATLIPLSPEIEQAEIVKRIKEQFEIIDSVSKKVIECFDKFNQLDQAILTKAFRGELVPQDPNDDPASILLERIRNRREQLAALTKKPVKNQRRNKMGKKSSRSSSQRRILSEVLTAKGGAMPPEQLLTEAGYDDDSVEDFYVVLREEIKKGHIRENRLNEKDVILEAVGQ